ncbi:GntR family transcriptional regulator [Paenibacillus motobuensis]|uniref:GntR family transcriptional regulator n=1 Tax=Paenibacillus TaxID=44249 RepID=UPI00203E2919|nr:MULTISPECIES: GntR family transcriptional regulator [Paenibacillus]MCM3038424.1 GntR family transcriptional regulator [Paenibacillus lutimineralis]MCM3645528.1 GntR family transcriptional regulator [Paenibacillus motobuensis]
MEQIPLYQHIVNTLKARIASGELQPGDQLPTEAELSKEFKVSRITSKRALTELENANLIYRVQGKGSFVHADLPPLRPLPRIGKEILFILPFTHNPGLGDYEKGINEYLATTDYTLNIQSNTVIGQRRLLETALHNNNSGLIIYPVSSSEDLGILYQYYQSKFPLVTMDKIIDGISFPYVVSDNFDGGYRACKHLIDNNHKRIAFLTPSRIEKSSSIRERYFGYLQALYDNGLIDYSVNDLTERYLSHEGGDGKEYYRAFIQAVMDNGITGIVAENDLIAIEIMQIAKDIGLSIPDDFSIVGFDNIHLSSFVEPRLTTISQDFAQMGYMAAKSLIGMLEDPQRPQDNVIVPVQLIQRQTVKRL